MEVSSRELLSALDLNIMPQSLQTLAAARLRPPKTPSTSSGPSDCLLKEASRGVEARRPQALIKLLVTGFTPSLQASAAAAAQSPKTSDDHSVRGSRLCDTGKVLTFSHILLHSLLHSHSKRPCSQASAAAASATAEDALGAVRTVRAFAQEASEGARYGAKVDESLQYGIAQARTVGWSSGGLFALSSGAMVAVLWYGARLTIAGELSAGALSSFVLYSLTGER